MGDAEAAEKVEEESVAAFNVNLKQFWEQQSEAKLRKKKMAEEAKVQRERERLEAASASIEDLFTEAKRVMRKKMDKAGDGESEDDDDDDDQEDEKEEEEDESLAMKTDGEKRDSLKDAEEARERKAKKDGINPDKFVQTVDLSRKRLVSVNEDDDEEEGAEDFDAQAEAIADAFAGDDCASEFK